MDIALASVMRDGLLRVSEAAALRWGDVELAVDGSGRIRIPESKTDQEAEGTVLYLGPAAVEALLAIRPEDAVVDASTPVFGLHPDTIRRPGGGTPRLAGDHWAFGSGGDGPGPVVSGVRPSRADDGGPVEVAQDARPLHGPPGGRPGGGGQVLPGRQGVEGRRRGPLCLRAATPAGRDAPAQQTDPPEESRSDGTSVSAQLAVPVHGVADVRRLTPDRLSRRAAGVVGKEPGPGTRDLGRQLPGFYGGWFGCNRRL